MSFRNHPKGLYTLFFTEMWERMSYYGMRGILVLFMTAVIADGGLEIDAKSASATRIRKELEKKNSKLLTSLNNEVKDADEIVKYNIDIKENTRLLKDEKDFKETFNKENLEEILTFQSSVFW